MSFITKIKKIIFKILHIPLCPEISPDDYESHPED